MGGGQWEGGGAGGEGAGPPEDMMTGHFLLRDNKRDESQRDSVRTCRPGPTRTIRTSSDHQDQFSPSGPVQTIRTSSDHQDLVDQIFELSRMWILLLLVCLLDQNQATPLPWEQLSSLQPFLQQVGQTSPSPPPDAGGQRTSSSSSSSSSSASSESSQSSEGPQLLRERERLETTAVEQTDSSQESPELRPSVSRSSLRLHELVLLGERVGERDRERETGDDSVASREHRGRPVLLTFHHLMTRPRGVALTAGGAAADLGVEGVVGGVVGGATRDQEVVGGVVGGATRDQDVVGGVVGGATRDQDVVGGVVGGATRDREVVGGVVGGATRDQDVVKAVVGGAEEGEETDAASPRRVDDSTERADGLTLDSPGHAHHHDYHGNEAGLELGL